jgi:hypothetical protein
MVWCENVCVCGSCILDDGSLNNVQSVPGKEAQFSHQGGVLVDGIAKTKK